jgi:hypothetical protein
MRTHSFKFQGTPSNLVDMARREVRVRTDWGADTQVEFSDGPNNGTLKIVAKRRCDLERGIQAIKGDPFYAQHFKD